VSANVPHMTVEIRVELKAGILDGEAESVHKSLGLLGIGPVSAVRTAKVYVLDLPGADRERAQAIARDAVDRLLANPVIQRVQVSLRAA
jgi:phosphoribosylformylglycinamidine synthase subunit PurS